MSIKEEAVTLVVGLGEVGKPLYTILKRQEPGTIGIDREHASVEKLVGIMHICFPFIDSNQFQNAFSGDLCLTGIGTTRKLLAIMNGEDFIEGYFAADLSFKPLDLDLLARRYAILLSPTANYGVHAASRLNCQTLIISVGWGLRQRSL